MTGLTVADVAKIRADEANKGGRWRRWTDEDLKILVDCMKEMNLLQRSLKRADGEAISERLGGRFDTMQVMNKAYNLRNSGELGDILKPLRMFPETVTQGFSEWSMTDSVDLVKAMSKHGLISGRLSDDGYQKLQAELASKGRSFLIEVIRNKVAVARSTDFKQPDEPKPKLAPTEIKAKLEEISQNIKTQRKRLRKMGWIKNKQRAPRSFKLGVFLKEYANLAERKEEITSELEGIHERMEKLKQTRVTRVEVRK